MSNCRICKRLVGSVAVTVTDAALVINIPDATYDNCERLCLAVLQAIPTTATRGLPVVITIGTGTTEYSLIKCDGSPVTQEYIGEGNIYKLKVFTTSSSGVFKVLNELCTVSVNVPSIPVAAPAAGG